MRVAPAGGSSAHAPTRVSLVTFVRTIIIPIYRHIAP